MSTFARRIPTANLHTHARTPTPTHTYTYTYTYTHTTTQPDKTTATGFTGLPESWSQILVASGITKEDAVENPQAVLDCLTFHIEGPPPEKPTGKKLQDDIARTVHIKSDDPLKYFSDLRKLGQGASGVVYSATDTRNGKSVALKVAPIAELVDLTNEIAMQAMSKVSEPCGRRV